jgi:putative colanic acid biosynthesis acetyltransferase WcaF
VQASLYRFTPNALRPIRRALLRAFGAHIASTSSPNNRARIDFPWNLELRDHASIGEHAWIYALDRITVGEYACIGQYVHVLTGSHDYEDPSFKLCTRPVEIGRGAWIAARATLLPGAHIGEYSVIGAGAVVTRPMPAGMVCVGNPCVPLKKRNLPQLSNRDES